jgi:hypothetical protein
MDPLATLTADAIEFPALAPSVDVQSYFVDFRTPEYLYHLQNL